MTLKWPTPKLPFSRWKVRTMLARQLRPTKSVVLAPPAKRFDSAVRAELLEDLTLEFVDPPVSYAHSRRDLLVWDSFGQILHEFVLPLRQRRAT